MSVKILVVDRRKSGSWMCDGSLFFEFPTGEKDLFFEIQGSTGFGRFGGRTRSGRSERGVGGVTFDEGTGAG